VSILVQDEVISRSTNAQGGARRHRRTMRRTERRQVRGCTRRNQPSREPAAATGRVSEPANAGAGPDPPRTSTLDSVRGHQSVLS
jgi:hypothetical protein